MLLFQNFFLCYTYAIQITNFYNITIMRSVSTKSIILFTLSFMLGIYFQATFCTWHPLMLLCILGYFAQSKSLILTKALIVIAGFLCGSIATMQQELSHQSYQHLLNKPCTAIGTVKSVTKNDFNSHKLTIEVSSVTARKISTQIKRKIELFCRGRHLQTIEQGSTIQIQNLKLKQPNKSSFRMYLIKENVWAVGHVDNQNILLLKKPSWLKQQLNKVQKSFHKASLKLAKKTSCLYRYIMLGDKAKSFTGKNYKKLFQLWGISHQLARSGLHVIMLIWALMLCMRILPCSYNTKLLLTGGMLFLYATATIPSTAFLRAIYMYFAYALCKICKIPTSPLHIVTCACLIIITQSPYQIFALDFQLSFTATITIIAFFKMTQRIENIAS